MATLSDFASLLAVIPSKKTSKGGVAATGTYNPQSSQNVLTKPQYQEHLSDIYTSRVANSSQTLLKELFHTDPDVSATVSSYLTLANTELVYYARDLEGKIDLEATKQLTSAVSLLTRQVDYSLGYSGKQSLRALCENMRYMLLLRGAIGVELVLDEKLAPSELRQVDMASIEWYEKKPGQYKPIQKIAGSDKEINLDIPTFFTGFFRRDPTTIYTYSHFVAAINAIAARQQVVNDLYRIMQFTGFPRIDVAVMEEIVTKSMPANVRADPNLAKSWLGDRLNDVANTFSNLRSDQTTVHFDSIEPKVINDKNPGAGIDITAVIETLNAQNQAGLKTMATVIGRGTSGVNTASVEARIAAMNADELNFPLADLLQNVFSFLLHQQGYEGFAEVYFEKVEMRPTLELEPQLTMLDARMQTDLSLGLITDDEYHLWVHSRPRPDSAPELAGTGFMAAAKPNAAGDNLSDPPPEEQPNSLNRSLSSPGARSAKSNVVKIGK